MNSEPPERMDLDLGSATPQWVFLDAAGQLLAVIFPTEVCVFSLANPKRWRPFSLEGEEVVLASSAPDQSGVLLHTNRKAFRILLFDQPQTFIGP